MSYLGWLDVILIALGLGISVTPAYKNYRYQLWQKFGYWNALVLPILMLIANIVLFLRKVKHNKKFGFIFCLNFNLNIF